MDRKNLKISCPSCEKSFTYYASEFRPFCSERCKMVDLGLWLSESYTIESRENLSDNDIEKVIENQEENFDL